MGIAGEVGGVHKQTVYYSAPRSGCNARQHNPVLYNHGIHNTPEKCHANPHAWAANGGGPGPGRTVAAQGSRAGGGIAAPCGPRPPKARPRAVIPGPGRGAGGLGAGGLGAGGFLNRSLRWEWPSSMCMPWRWLRLCTTRMASKHSGCIPSQAPGVSVYLNLSISE